jgi:hypothetical protein
MLTPWWRRLWAALPKGNLLSPKTWHVRHRGIVIFLWTQAAGLAGLALLLGETLAHSLVEGGAVAATAVLASVEALPRRVRSAVASLGLVVASAVLVHISGGYIEMHFHFFVMVGLLALYQDGIDPAYHGKIFEVFQRLQDIPTHGTGMGLAIVKKIVEGAGGRVWVESARGEGATFRFTWPAAPARVA